MKYLLALLFFVFFISCIDSPIGDNCTNNILDAGESGIDCGGLCPDCNEVSINSELAIKHLSVVNSVEAMSGVFSFGELMFNLADRDTMQTKLLIQSLFSSWDSNQVVNGFTVLARPGFSDQFLGEWMRRDGASSLDEWNITWGNAPLRLLAITNRIDLHDLESLSAGEGRLTFGQDDNGANDFTLIFEYNLNIEEADSTHVISWAKKWHKLSTFIDTSNPEYLKTLVDIVTEFTSSNVKLNALRTNSIIGRGPWEFREFNIENGVFIEQTRKQNPDVSLNNTSQLQDYLEHPIISKELDELNHIVRDSILAGNTSYGGNFRWQAENIPSKHLELLDFISCTGCHGGFQSGTGFTHIRPRSQNQESSFSPFMKERLSIRKNSMNSLLKTPDEIIVNMYKPDLQLLDSLEIREIEKLRKFAKLKTVH